MPVFESNLGPVAFVCVGIAFVFGKSTLLAGNRKVAPTDPYRDILMIGSHRTVSRMLVECGGKLVWVVNIHLHSPIAASACRLEQMKQVLAWMEPVRQRGVGCVMMGDFNAGPAEPCYKLLAELGWKSAHKSAHGQEPAVTFPGDGAGLMASTKDCDPAGTFGRARERERGSWRARERERHRDAANARRHKDPPLTRGNRNPTRLHMAGRRRGPRARGRELVPAVRRQAVRR